MTERLKTIQAAWKGSDGEDAIAVCRCCLTSVGSERALPNAPSKVETRPAILLVSRLCFAAVLCIFLSRHHCVSRLALTNSAQIDVLSGKEKKIKK